MIPLRTFVTGTLALWLLGGLCLRAITAAHVARALSQPFWRVARTQWLTADVPSARRWRQALVAWVVLGFVAMLIVALFAPHAQAK